MKITEKDLIRQIAGFPIEVVEKMLERSFEQTGKKDVNGFQKEAAISVVAGGFEWEKTPEGYGFWHKVISYRQFNIFFDRYPKKTEYPKLMWVWDNTEAGKIKRVVFMKKNGRYLAWNTAKTLKDAETVFGSTPWIHAEDIIEPEKIEIASEVPKETCIKIISENNVVSEVKLPIMAICGSANQQMQFIKNIEIKIT